MKPMKTSRRTSKGNVTSLEGQLLIAMPSMTDKRFQRSVIYLCAHSAEGAMGLIINQRAANITFPELLEQIGVEGANGGDLLPARVQDMPVHVGGPVEQGRGFVLHTADYLSDDATLRIDGSTCLTATVDILKAIAGGRGPKRSILALGYSGWAPGQLETEIQANGWLHCAADSDLVFAADLGDKYDRALGKLGVDPTHLVCEAGHA